MTKKLNFISFDKVTACDRIMGVLQSKYQVSSYNPTSSFISTSVFASKLPGSVILVNISLLNDIETDIANIRASAPKETVIILIGETDNDAD